MEEKDPSVSLLDAAVRRWLTYGTPGSGSAVSVMLLHGRSGSGKSLSCKLLERDLWAAYRRGDVQCYTPLFVSLPSTKDPERGAVDEVLSLCNLSLKQLTEESPRRRWLVIIDGYDEVAGSTNFVVNNRLPSLLPPNARVVVSCRTEYLEGKGSYRHLFRPDSSDTTLTELYVRPFGSSQVGAVGVGASSGCTVEISGPGVLGGVSYNA